MNTIGFAAPSFTGGVPAGDGIKHLFLISPVMGYETNLSFDNSDRELIVGRRSDCDINLPYEIISRLPQRLYAYGRALFSAFAQRGYIFKRFGNKPRRKFKT